MTVVAELRGPGARAALREIVRQRGRITLVTATHDLEHSGATVLAKVMSHI